MKAIRINTIYNTLYAITEFNLEGPVYTAKVYCVDSSRLISISNEAICTNFEVIGSMIIPDDNVQVIELEDLAQLKKFNKTYKPLDDCIYEILYEIADIGFTENGNLWELFSVTPKQVFIDDKEINIESAVIKFYSSIKSEKLCKYIIAEDDGIYTYKVDLSDFTRYGYLTTYNIVVKDDVVKNDIATIKKEIDEDNSPWGDIVKWKNYKLEKLATLFRVASALNEKTMGVY